MRVKAKAHNWFDDDTVVMVGDFVRHDREWARVDKIFVTDRNDQYEELWVLDLRHPRN